MQHFFDFNKLGLKNLSLVLRDLTFWPLYYLQSCNLVEKNNAKQQLFCTSLSYQMMVFLICIQNNPHVWARDFIYLFIYYFLCAQYIDF